MNKPMWECPRCGRQFANRNQAHGCTELPVADCLRNKNEKLVKAYKAFAAAVLGCGDVRIHPTKSRIAFIARMTFAGAILKRDHVEASVMLPYRSHHSRFHKLFPSGAGGVHYFKLVRSSEVDLEIRNWLREAFLCGMQEPLSPKLSKKVKTAELPKPARRSTKRVAPAKMFYLHWNEKELEERSAPLRKAGHSHADYDKIDVRTVQYEGGPIKTEKDHAKALKEIERLWGRQGRNP